MDISIKWQDGGDKWRELNLDDIAHMPRSHAIDLFNRTVPVIIKEGDDIISNDLAMRNLYRKQGKRVHKLDDIIPSNGRLSIIGFLGRPI